MEVSGCGQDSGVLMCQILQVVARGGVGGGEWWMYVANISKTAKAK